MSKKINHEEVLEKIRQIKSLQSSVKALEKDIEENKDYIKNMMLSHKLDEYEVDVFRVTYKEINSSKFDSKKFEQERPDLYKKYLTESSYKKLLIS